MGNYTIVIHGTGAHHNWALEAHPDRPEHGRTYITGRSNDYDADLMFAEFVDKLRAKGHNITGATFTHGGMEGADNVVRADYQNPHLPPKAKGPSGPPSPLSDEQIKHLVDRFLGWRLPEDFRPDGGVQFDADAPLALSPHNRRHEPMGTNLFDATQATAMVRHMIEGMPR